MIRLLCLIAATALATSHAASRPGIVVILSDDMGFSDLGCYGGEIPTPQLDALAAGGLRFTQFYNSARCCPTRASLLTGLYPHQAGIGHMTDDRGHDGYRGDLNSQCLTIAEALREGGYRTYMTGKWHVTKALRADGPEARRNWPLQRGFDRFYGTIIGGGSFWDPAFLTRDNTPVSAFSDPAYQPAQPYYYTDAIADHAVRFLQDHAAQHPDKPFFLYVAFTAAHWPMHAREEDIAANRGRYDSGYDTIRRARYQRMQQLGIVTAANTTLTPAPTGESGSPHESWDRRNMEVYAAMVMAMDRGISRLVAQLRSSGTLDNTLICYLQDNGGCAEGMGRQGIGNPRTDQPSLPAVPSSTLNTELIPRQTRDGYPVRQGKGVMAGGPDTYIGYGEAWAAVSNTPFREYKHWTHEGGISTPLIVHWPAAIPANRRGRLEHSPGHLIDLMPTCLEAGRATYPDTSGGLKLKPLEGLSLIPALKGTPSPRRTPLFWEHEGNRAVRMGPWKLVAKESQPWELYNIDSDRSEQHNLADAHPERVSTMAATWDAYAARCDVLPLGSWRAAANQKKSPAAFHWKDGEPTSNLTPPAIGGRSFTLSATFASGPESSGVIAAHGGSNHGYALHLSQNGSLHFTVRREGSVTTVSVPISAGSHSARASLGKDGKLRLSLDGAAPAESDAGPLMKQPLDGIDIGNDRNGQIAPPPQSHPFRGRILSLSVE
jgi:arylsulfatase